MTLLEVFNSMDEVDKPRFRVDGESFYAGVIHSYDDDGEPVWTWNIVPVWLAESAICWAMVKAMADAGHCPSVCMSEVDSNGVNYLHGEGGRTDALHAAYQAMKEAR